MEDYKAISKSETDVSGLKCGTMIRFQETQNHMKDVSSRHEEKSPTLLETSGKLFVLLFMIDDIFVEVLISTFSGLIFSL